jgi:hypothetical protein
MVDIKDLMSSVPTAQAEQGPRLLPGGRTQVQPYPSAAAQTGTPYSLREIGELGLSHMEVAPELDAADRLLREYELGKQSRQASRIKAVQQEREMELRGIGARIIDQLKGESLVEQQQSQLARHVDQSLNAVNAAEDQMTGRVKHALQQNPHLDMSQVEVLEEMADVSYRQGMEQDEPINVAAAQMTGRVPNDQVEEITGPQAAQQFFQQRREELAAQGIRGLRAEKMLAEPLMKGSPYVEGTEGYQQRQQKKGLALALQTGDPNVLKVFQTGELPSTIKLQAGASQLGEVPTSEFLTKTSMPEAIEGAKERYQERVGKAQNWLNTKLNELEPQRNQILQERRELVEQNAALVQSQLKEAKINNQIGRVNQLEGTLNSLRTLWQNPELGMHRQEEYGQLTRQVEGAKRKINQSIENMQVEIPETLKTWSDELLKVTPVQETTLQAGYLNAATGEFIPSRQVEQGSSQPIVTKEGLELGPVSQARELKAKGGGGRNVAEYVAGNRPPEIVQSVRGVGRMRDYDPLTGGVAEHYQPDLTQTESTTRIDYDPQTGKRIYVTETTPGLNRAVDVYGTRLSTQARANPNLKPSAVESSRFPLGPLTQEPTETARRSVDISEQLIRAQREGGTAKAQALLDSFKKGLI